MARLEQLFSTGGDGSGITEMAGLPALYKVSPPPGYTYELHRMNAVLEDGTKFSGDLYGGISALTNGIVITTEGRKGVIVNHTPQPIKKSGHWALVAGVDMAMTDFTTGNDIITVRWTFTKGGDVIRLSGNEGEFMQVNVRDTLAGLVSHIIQVQGMSLWTGGE
jgi:hypothetical protein